jgi:hypothetical protein
MAEYTPGLKPDEAKFFKICELGYDSAQGLHAVKAVTVQYITNT